MTRAERYRLGFWKGIFFLLLAVGSALTVVRYTQGLGSVTHLSDRFPWGLWIGFDVLCGVGLAAGGFTITTAVYVFNVKRWKPIVRPTILTAFLGYLLVVVALAYDLGRPWNLARPWNLWNPHSVMFEVAWCVILYNTVLFLEFSGMVFEKLGWTRALVVQQTVTLPLVMAGALLSTLHQSSLGSLYLIVPGKLHPLWYSPLLPVIFLVSSICVGLAMVIVESRLSARAFGRRLEMPLLGEVGRVLVAALGFYGVVRLYDLVHRHALARAFDGSAESLLFLLEFLLGVVVPMGLLASPAVRRHGQGLYASALLVILGFVVTRLNVSITGFESAQGGHYVPAWSEFAITLMLVALGFAAFSLAVKHLNVYPEAGPPEAGRLPAAAAAVPAG
jgi:Ni/Fe-hydrogenase subunit HybB-like protein